MRTSLACSFCRSQKHKCVHDGVAPCRTCEKRNFDCVISPTVKKSKKDRQRRHTNESIVTSNSSSSTLTTNTTDYSSKNVDGPTTKSTFPREITNNHPSSIGDDPMVDVPIELFQIASQRVRKRFPELSFLHLNSIMFFPQLVDPYLKCSIMALCGYFTPIKNDKFLDFNSRYVQDEIFANYTLNNILSPTNLLSKPSLDLAQCLLLMSVYEWGKSKQFRCWMLHGCSCKMLQSLGFDENNSSPELRNELQRETTIRTFWSSFIVDRIVGSGRNRSLAYSSSDASSVPLPVSEATFESGSMSSMNGKRVSIRSLSTLHSDDILLPMYIRIFELWGEISMWLVRGGRREFLDLPWAPQAFYTTQKSKIIEWVELLPENSRWSISNFRAHRFMNTETLFCATNLVHRLCAVFLNREYLPFLPHSTPSPQGPCEPPLLPPPPIANFWEVSTSELFESAREIATIVELLDANDENPTDPATSPFISFCAFCAGSVSLYAWKFPWMDTPDWTLNCSAAQKMQKYLQKRRHRSDLESNWSNLLLQLEKLYDSVSNNLGKARVLNLGRNSFSKLEESVQIINSSTSLANNEIDKANHTISDESHDEFPAMFDVFHASMDQSTQVYLNAFLESLDESI
ncbi:hypothetical protein CANARDRAFT_30408 [[Candida] arabinofermentans NRRL YB-2248]|uniref:Zn(2)-C6 fungal-type domain-containing protein n=1 Tax=[Candida] arabinofermentans NRRL YB-2248 TaxID=983967 RepID=A0A1E4STU5_9ASCO|nr:hypothetical protein CANARDRAFT_30408 [[Candida] arabinofermentans NRRL YB-2248]